jgi:hypothetical protein
MVWRMLTTGEARCALSSTLFTMMLFAYRELCFLFCEEPRSKARVPVTKGSARQKRGRDSCCRQPPVLMEFACVTIFVEIRPILRSFHRLWRSSRQESVARRTDRYWNSCEQGACCSQIRTSKYIDTVESTISYDMNRPLCSFAHCEASLTSHDLSITMVFAT